MRCVYMGVLRRVTIARERTLNCRAMCCLALLSATVRNAEVGSSSLLPSTSFLGNSFDSANSSDSASGDCDRFVPIVADCSENEPGGSAFRASVGCVYRASTRVELCPLISMTV